MIYANRKCYFALIVRSKGPFKKKTDSRLIYLVMCLPRLPFESLNTDTFMSNTWPWQYRERQRGRDLIRNLILQGLQHRFSPTCP